MPPKKKQKAGFLKEHFLKIIAFASIIAIASLFRGDYSVIEYFRIEKKINKVKTHNNTLEYKKVILEAEKERLKSDKNYIEKIAREKYKMAKKDEKIIRIVKSSGSDN